MLVQSFYFAQACNTEHYIHTYIYSYVPTMYTLLLILSTNFYTTTLFV